MWFREREVEVIRMGDLNSGRQKKKNKRPKSRRLATWIPAVAAERSSNETVSSCQLRLLFFKIHLNSKKYHLNEFIFLSCYFISLNRNYIILNWFKLFKIIQGIGFNFHFRLEMEKTFQLSFSNTKQSHFEADDIRDAARRKPSLKCA